jgi:hypothetical protein
MTPVATTPLFIDGGSRFIPHIIRLKDIPSDLRASMTEVWDALMDLNHFNDTLLPDTFTDLFLKQYTGRSGRFIQKGLKGLQDHDVIFRHTLHGRRNIEITGRIAGRKEKAPDPKPKEPPKPRKGRTGPALGPPSTPTTPEHLAAAAAARAAAAETPEPTAESSEDQPRPDESPVQFVARLKAKLAAATAPEKAAAGGLAAAVAPKVEMPSPRVKLDREIAKIEAIKESERLPWMVAELATLKERLASLDDDDQGDPPARE